MTYMPRVKTFGRNAVRIVARPGETLSLDMIRAHAPAIFAEQPHESRSEKFIHIPTDQMLDALIKEGFFPTAVTVGGSKDEHKRAFTKHQIRLRRPEHFNIAKRPGAKVGDTLPEVVLQNGHDGTSAYLMELGLFRLACLNGMIVQDKQIGAVKVPHRGDALSKVIEGSYEVLREATYALDAAENMAHVELSRDEQKVFAMSIAALRFEDAIPADIERDPMRMIEARRRSDAGMDLWSTFNRAQENVIRGGISFEQIRFNEQNQRQTIQQTTRPVQSVDGDARLNRAMWVLAEGMRQLKA